MERRSYAARSYAVSCDLLLCLCCVWGSVRDYPRRMADFGSIAEHIFSKDDPTLPHNVRLGRKR